MPVAQTIARVQYHQYINSAAWRERRRDALARARYQCQLCASTESLNVHHNSYERLGQERPEDLVVLCRRCHEVFHAQRDDRTRDKMLADNPDLAAVKPATPIPPPSFEMGFRERPAGQPVVEADDSQRVTITITPEFLKSLMSDSGGITSSVLVGLGEPAKNCKGWYRRLIGKRVTLSQQWIEMEQRAARERSKKNVAKAVLKSARTSPVAMSPEDERLMCEEYRSRGFKFAGAVAERFGVTKYAVRKAAKNLYGADPVELRKKHKR